MSLGDGLDFSQHINDADEEWYVFKDDEEYGWSVLPGPNLKHVIQDVQRLADQVCVGPKAIIIRGLRYQPKKPGPFIMIDQQRCVKLYQQHFDPPLELRCIYDKVQRSNVPSTTSTSNVPPSVDEDEKEDFAVNPAILFKNAHRSGAIKDHQLIPKSEWKKWNMSKVNWQVMQQEPYQSMNRAEKGVQS